MWEYFHHSKSKKVLKSLARKVETVDRKVDFFSTAVASKHEEFFMKFQKGEGRKNHHEESLK